MQDGERARVGTAARGGELAAVVDVGTHSALLLVGRRGPRGEPCEVDALARAPQLGARLASTGRIDEAAVARLAAALGEFAARCDALGVPAGRRRLVGTAVFRRASNAGEVLRGVRAATGLELEVLSEDDEARLAFAGARAATGGGAAIVLDGGGGSTEIAWAGGRERRSLPVGAVVATERWLGLAGRPALDRGGWAALLAGLRRSFAAWPAGLAEEREVVALGGTATNLAALELGLAAFDHRPAEGLRCPAARALAWAERLAAESAEQRLARPIEVERAAVLPAGLACLGIALERLGARELRVSNRGLRFAVLEELLGS